MDGLEGWDLVISDEKVVFGIIWPHIIVAIQGNAKLAKTGWPRISHDNRNTFNVNKH